jgi:RNA recognition motif-containing protein
LSPTSFDSPHWFEARFRNQLHGHVPVHVEAKFMTIYVGNLNYRVTKEDIHEVFAEYGTVKNVVLPMDRETGRMRGFAFVEMSGDDQEDKAIMELDGAEWMGRQLRVNKARPKGSFGGNRRDFNPSGV